MFLLRPFTCFLLYMFCFVVCGPQEEQLLPWWQLMEIQTNKKISKSKNMPSMSVCSVFLRRNTNFDADCSNRSLRVLKYFLHELSLTASAAAATAERVDKWAKCGPN